MLTLKNITENQDEVVRRLSKKHFKAKDITDQIIALDSIRRTSQAELEANLSEINRISKEIGTLMQAGKKPEADEAKATDRKSTRLNSSH